MPCLKISCHDMNKSLFSCNDINNHYFNTHCYLGLTFSYNLKWNAHIDNVTVKASQRTNMMIPLKYKLDKTSLQTMYLTFVRPVMEYGISVWGE